LCKKIHCLSLSNNFHQCFHQLKIPYPYLNLRNLMYEKRGGSNKWQQCFCSYIKFYRFDKIVSIRPCPTSDKFVSVLPCSWIQVAIKYIYSQLNVEA
jgi:hypothetical protein